MFCIIATVQSCVLIVKDEPDQQTFEMSMSRVLEFKSCFEFDDVVQYCNMMGISFEYDNFEYVDIDTTSSQHCRYQRYRHCVPLEIYRKSIIDINAISLQHCRYRHVRRCR